MKILPWLRAACIDFIILNLFITIVSLPIMAAWGLPVSWLSPFGNLIFNPFLTIFLLVSTLLFFCELLSIPHGFLDRLLEYIASIWNYLMHLAPQNSFFGCPRSALYALTILSILTLILLALPYFQRQYPRAALLILLFGCTLTVLKAAQPADLSKTVVCNKKHVRLIRESGKTILIDDGAFSEKTNPQAWVQYDLLAEIIKETGSPRVDYLLLSRPTIRALQAATALMQHAHVETIYYALITGDMTGSHKFTFRKWYAIAKSKGVQLKRIWRSTELKIASQCLTITPQESISYNEISYKPLHIE